MKSIVKYGLVPAATFLALAVTAPARSDVKIGYVDYSRLMEDSPQAKTALEALRNEFAARQRQLQNEQTTLKSKEDKLAKDGATMTEEQRSRAEKELRDGARDLQRRNSELQDDFNARRNEETSRLQRTLVEEVRNYAKTQSYDLVIAESVIYATPAIDITPAVLAVLQVKSPAKAAAPAAAPAAGKTAAPAKAPGR